MCQNQSISKTVHSYVFDFLACKIKDTENISDILNKSSDNFRWVEVKNEGGKAVTSLKL